MRGGSRARGAGVCRDRAGRLVRAVRRGMWRHRLRAPCFAVGSGTEPDGRRRGIHRGDSAVHDVFLQAKVQAAAARTRARRTARTSVSVTLTGVGDRDLSTAAFDVAGSGVVDLVHGDADLTLQRPALRPVQRRRHGRGTHRGESPMRGCRPGYCRCGGDAGRRRVAQPRPRARHRGSRWPRRSRRSIRQVSSHFSWLRRKTCEPWATKRCAVRPPPTTR